MSEFLKFFNKMAGDFPMHLEIAYNKTCDWHIVIYKKGCASDYPENKAIGDDAIICNANDHFMEVAFAKAFIQFKEWLLEHNGGY